MGKRPRHLQHHLSHSCPQQTKLKQIKPIVVGGLTVYAAPLPQEKSQAPDTGQNIPLATVAGQTISQLPNGSVVIDGTTLTPGASPITIAGTPISLNPTALVIDGTQTIPRPTLPPSPLIPFTTVAGEAISRNADGAVVVKGETLTPNGPGVTIAGTPVSIAISADRTFLIEGTRTTPLAASITAMSFQPFGEVVSADKRGVYVVGGQTLVPGGEAIMVVGIRVSLGFGGNGVEVVVGGRTSKVLPASMASSMNTVRGSRNGTVATGQVVNKNEPTGTAGVGENGLCLWLWIWEVVPVYH
ncbi:MAG: hypothetical protein Q9226_005364 [Calogaya cf. arnoldii]